MTLSILRKLVEPRAVQRARPERTRLSLLALEDRVALSTLFVGPAAQYHSIQAAVNAAKTGDTVQVAPGTYNEVVTVEKRLTLIGSGPQHGKDRSGGALETVVQAASENPLGIINLRSNDIVLRGFTVQGNTAGPGVFTDPKFSGYDIEGNLVWKNNPAQPGDPHAPSGGLNLNSSGGHLTVVRDNAFEDHTVESSGDGVYTELTIRNARIEDNYFKGNVHYSVDFAGAAGDPEYPGFKKFYPRSLDVVVTHNTVELSGGFLVQYADRIDVTNNVITQAIRTGVYVGGDVHQVTVSGNHLTDAAVVDNVYFHGKHTGIFVGTLDIPGKIQGVVASGNTVQGYRNGIWLAGDPATGAVSHVTVEGNTLLDSGDPYGHQFDADPFGYGIVLTDADHNTVRNNTVSGNASGGIYVDAASTANTFTKNTAMGNTANGGYDLYDGSTGRGTGGTANRWLDNDFGTANRPGLY